MWTLKICIVGITMLCDNTTYSNYITLAQCLQAQETVLQSNVAYITSCEFANDEYTIRTY